MLIFPDSQFEAHVVHHNVQEDKQKRYEANKHEELLFELKHKQEASGRWEWHEWPRAI